ncbi:MAG: baseplate J/gp47 family protein [Chloroflexota bacterium]
MPLQSPNLDDRTWRQLVDSATARIGQGAPEWSDLSPGDPGIVLLEVFAYLTESLLYRLNRVPDKLFIEFLRLIGVRLQPPAAAAVDLVFTRERGTTAAVDIPRGTHVTIARPGGGEAPVFETTVSAAIPAGEESVTVRALHAERVEFESLGAATGDPGLVVSVARPPIIGSTGDGLDLIVAVEVDAAELEDGDPAVEHGGRTYRIWREVDNFTYLGADRYVYLADRMAGSIMFAPAARSNDDDAVLADDPEIVLADTPDALAATPPRGRDILVSYRRGGGVEGNVAAGTLTTVKESIRATATNPEPAAGGRAAETLDNARIRGPQELHTLSRAVTARDFQLAAERASGAVARAKAVTQAELWRYATPGTVEVFLVPNLPEGDDPTMVTAEQLTATETGDVLDTVRSVLDARRSLGTTLRVDWVRYKTVHVRAEIVVHREEDRGEVQRRVDERIHATVNPLPTELNAGGYPYGQSLYASSVYKIILSEPGVRYARGVQLVVDAVPNEAVLALAADPFQPRTWYAGAGPILFRTLNDGDGWEAMTEFGGETVVCIQSHPDRPGLVAVATLITDSTSRVSVSRDSGATWVVGDPTGFRVRDIDWIDRDDEPILLMATDVGLYQLPITPGADPVQVLVDPADQGLGFWTVAVSTGVRGEVSVAVGAFERKGVFLSSEGGQFQTFRNIGLAGRDVWVLRVQRDGPNRFLWAGIAATSGDDPGEGAHSWQLLGREDPVEKWRDWKGGWQGGSCWAIAFRDGMVHAASNESGVLWLDTAKPDAMWQVPTVGSGLPLRDLSKFHPVRTVATSPDGRLLMAGGVAGVRRSRDGGASYDDPSGREFDEEVTIPPTWLLVDGQNDITVTTADG